MYLFFSTGSTFVCSNIDEKLIKKQIHKKNSGKEGGYNVTKNTKLVINKTI